MPAVTIRQIKHAKIPAMTDQRTAQFHVLIPAAGAGSRMRNETPKQYLPLLGRPLIEYALRVFLTSPRISSVTVVLSADDNYWNNHLAGFTGNACLKVVRCGGATRSETVLNGLLDMEATISAEDWVLVHDAARPGLTSSLLDKLLDALQDDPVGGLLAIPLADTLKRADAAQRVAATEPRDSLWQAQTPQMFRFGLLKRALIEAGGKPTDEAQAVEALGHRPKLVPGELRNLKITYPEDLLLAEAVLAYDNTFLKDRHD
jgi:2-C-methyl-D-erythritol 4-phosphate cytidylyltransferase